MDKPYEEITLDELIENAVWMTPEVKERTKEMFRDKERKRKNESDSLTCTRKKRILEIGNISSMLLFANVSYLFLYIFNIAMDKFFYLSVYNWKDDFLFV